MPRIQVIVFASPVRLQVKALAPHVFSLQWSPQEVVRIDEQNGYFVAPLEEFRSMSWGLWRIDQAQMEALATTNTQRDSVVAVIMAAPPEIKAKNEMICWFALTPESAQDGLLQKKFRNQAIIIALKARGFTTTKSRRISTTLGKLLHRPVGEIATATEQETYQLVTDGTVTTVERRISKNGKTFPIRAIAGFANATYAIYLTTEKKDGHVWRQKIIVVLARKTAEEAALAAINRLMDAQ